ncbi:sugar transferase [Microbacterium sp. AZCO]|uniref:sugar transferase n=1 Tax=Microbacterium sp. AZCO TaxID=3142976 RepID=UPI0031F38B1D
MISQNARPYDLLKRVLDVLSAILLLIITSPLMLVSAMLVLNDLGRPVLFRQARAGQGGHRFTLLKFRSMRPATESEGSDSDADRLTAVGRLLRATSLDELPSLVNVIRGDMSIVGPRPLLLEYLPRYSAQQARRHEVRPGITGLAQVSGRNNVAWDDRLAADVEYVDKRSLRLDAWILARTARTVLVREGISADGHATSPEFLGSEGGPA